MTQHSSFGSNAQIRRRNTLGNHQKRKTRRSTARAVASQCRAAGGAGVDGLETVAWGTAPPGHSAQTVLSGIGYAGSNGAGYVKTARER